MTSDRESERDSLCEEIEYKGLRKKREGSRKDRREKS